MDIGRQLGMIQNDVMKCYNTLYILTLYNLGFSA